MAVRRPENNEVNILTHVSRAVFGGDPARYEEIAVLNRIDPIPGTDTYPFHQATCC